MIRELRDKTGAGVLDCKRTLEDNGGDMEAALAELRRKGLAAAAKKAHRVASEGRVEPYVHAGGKLAAIVEVNCETDFVARTEEFIALAHDLAMQVAASNPRWVSRSDVPAEVIAEETSRYEEEMAGQNKPPAVMERIIKGKLEKFYQDHCLLDQAYIREPERNVQSLITDTITKMGENIVVRLARFQIGAERRSIRGGAKEGSSVGEPTYKRVPAQAGAGTLCRGERFGIDPARWTRSARRSRPPVSWAVSWPSSSVAAISGGAAPPWRAAWTGPLPTIWAWRPRS